MATGERPQVENEVRFKSARPVWAVGRATEMNVTLGFRAVFADPRGDRVILRVAASNLYRAFVNGEFCAHGPARGPHGFYRVDQIDITTRLKAGVNVVSIEVAGYNINSFYLLDQPAFLQAEVLADGKVVASTAGAGARFEARFCGERVQRVPRYSFQRTFVEAYRLRPGFDCWRRDPSVSFKAVKLAVAGRKHLLPRRVPWPEFLLRGPAAHVAHGRVRTDVEPPKIWKDRSLTQIGPKCKGYPEADLEVIPPVELQKIATVSRAGSGRRWSAGESVRLDAKGFHILDFGVNLTGFIGLRARCRRKVRLYLVFDELLDEDGDVNFRRMGSVNAVLCEFERGEYALETMEPYTFRYLKLIALDGACEISGVYLREYAHPVGGAAGFASSDERLNRLFAAGVETFRQNVVDIFMDCPSRERAGWLCDSFFTARVAADLCGNTLVERNFYENFLLPRRFKHLPAGMLPMCYPSDHRDGCFIPNWALWFVVQIEEYLARSGDRATVDALRPRILRLFEYFAGFRNQDGLLEKLAGWVFVEWSEANKLVQDVNYPTNMLYAGALAAAGRLYGLPKLVEDAERIRAVVRRQSFDGEFFVDNAVREKGRQCASRNRTEVCQYFAFFFDVATPQSHERLWRRLCRHFGPDRMKNGRFPEIHPAAPFIGNMLRLELLSRAGLAQQLLDESVGYLLYMAERTGTLWEVADENASCNHGFASHVAHVLYRDALGIYRVDPVNRVLRLRFCDLALDWCRGTLPVPGGAASLEWRRQGRAIHYRVDIPADWSLEIENLSRRRLG